uniref:Uncharacterized protein n=1 Tax=Arundo donax TaxID=35708 RepID=A0A0A9DW82_ARUDO
MRSQGKCRTSNESFEIMFVGETSSPISLADCRIVSRPVSTQSGDISYFYQQCTLFPWQCWCKLR